MNIIGDEKPTIRLLQNFVIPKVSAKWHELGIELYKNSDVGQLEKFKKESPSDYTVGCTKMFKYWLETYTDVTWERLIRALKAPGIQLNAVALDIKEEVIKG